MKGKRLKQWMDEVRKRHAEKLAAMSEEQRAAYWTEQKKRPRPRPVYKIPKVLKPGVGKFPVSLATNSTRNEPDRPPERKAAPVKRRLTADQATQLEARVRVLNRQDCDRHKMEDILKREFPRVTRADRRIAYAAVGLRQAGRKSRS